MMELEPLLREITSLTPTAIGIVLFAGLVVGVAPSSFPLLSVAAGFVGGQEVDPKNQQRYQGLVLSLGFVLGIALVDALIGVFFGYAGFLVMNFLVQYLPYAYLLITAMLILIGLILLRVIRLPFPVLRPSRRGTKNFFTAFALGIPFGLSTCPACTPLLLPVLMAAAGSGDPLLGGVLLFTFGMARGIPIIIVGSAAGAIKQTERFASWIPLIERTSGVLLLLAAPYFAYQAAAYAGWAPPLLSLF